MSAEFFFGSQEDKFTQEDEFSQVKKLFSEKDWIFDDDCSVSEDEESFFPDIDNPEVQADEKKPQFSFFQDVKEDS